MTYTVVMECIDGTYRRTPCQTRHEAEELAENINGLGWKAWVEER